MTLPRATTQYASDGYGFPSAPGTGIYRSGGNMVVSVGDADVATIDSTGIQSKMLTHSIIATVAATAAANTIFNTYYYVSMPWAGSIAGLSLSALNFTVTAGSVTLAATKNGTPMTPAVTLNSTGGTNNKVKASYAPGTYTFAAGDVLYLTYSSSALAGGSTFCGSLWVYA